MVERVVEEMNCDARNRHLELVQKTADVPDKEGLQSGKITIDFRVVLFSKKMLSPISVS